MKKEKREESTKMNNWKKWLIALFIVSLIFAILKISLNKDYKTEETGNNKTIQEIEEYILNITSYKAKISVTVRNNRNENNYIISQEVKQDFEKQEVLEPQEVSGMQITYQNRKSRSEKYKFKFKQDI